MKNLFLFLVLIIPQFLIASGEKGTYISSKRIGANSYEIRVNQYLDCASPIRRPSVFVDFSSDCGGSFRSQLFLKFDPFIELGDTIVPNARGGVEVSQLCDRQIQNSTCNGGNLPGTERVTYIDTVQLSPDCNKWYVFHNVGCCRIGTRNLSSTNNLGVLSELNTLGFPNNQTPIFTSNPSPILPVGKLSSYDPGIVDPDGDSLVIRLVDAIQGFNSTSNTRINDSYQFPYSGAEPITSMQIDSSTGLITVTPVATGLYVVNIEVEEYDRQGNFKASSVRDLLFSVGTIANNLPRLSGAVNYTGQGTQLSNTHIRICPNDGFDISLSVVDPDTSDTLSFTTNVQSSFPGTQITVQNHLDSIHIRMLWSGRAQAGESRFFSLEFNDGSCPIPGEFSLGIEVDIVGFDSRFDLEEVVCLDRNESARIEITNFQKGGTWSPNFLMVDSTGVYYNVNGSNHGESKLYVQHDSLGRCGSSFLDSVIVFTHFSDYEIWAAGTAYGLNLADNLHHFSHDSNFGKDTLFLPRTFSNSYDTLMLNNLESVAWYDQIVPNGNSFEIQYNADSIANRFGYGVYRMETNYQKNYPSGSCSFSDTAFVFICDDSLNLTITESYIPGPNANSLDTILTANPSGYLYRWMLAYPIQSAVRIWDTTLNVINISELRRQEGFPITEVELFAYERNSLGGPVQDTSRSCYFDNAVWSRVLSLSETQQSDFVKVYPNPTRSLIQIEASKKITGLRITNMLGEDLGFQNLQSQSHVLNVEHLTAGLYFLEIQMGAERKVLRLKKM